MFTSKASENNWINYIDKKLADLESNIRSEIKSTKRSILYELDKKVNEVKSMIIITSGGETRLENNSISAREKLGVPLPISSLEGYLEFDAQISVDQEKKQSLKSLFAVLIAGSTSWKDDVGKMMNAVISKAVQIHFSGCGRKIRGEGKRNFSGTSVFECMRDVLEEHYKDTMQPLQMVSRVSRWLAGAGDREGGRRGRSST